MSENLQSKLIAEAIATFALTFIGAGAIWVGGDLLTVAIAHGLILSVMVTATMNISGGHVNPAITIGMMASKRMDSKTGGAYIAAQLGGAILAGAILYSLGGGGAGTPAPQEFEGSMVSTQSAILVEAVLTFLLMTAIMGTAVDGRAPAGIAGFGIGLTVTVDILMGGPLTGAAMNPARWAGTWVFGDMENNIDLIIYTVGPILGSLLGVLLWDKMMDASDE
ncbi:MAG: aquaporin [Candidatus Thalassarchaeaceae archaeon]|jgi:aquaporin Z|nr:aquaporin [Candidatus Thalassarchaeaceae archaeon]